MQKNISLLILLTTIFAHGMEKVSLLVIKKNALSLIYNGTKINLIKKNLFDASDRVSLIVIGKHEQDMFSGGLAKFSSAGTMITPKNMIIYAKNENNKNEFDNDTYQPYPYQPGQMIPKLIDQREKNHKNYALKITEPCITESCYLGNEGIMSDFMYDTIINNRHETFTGDEAIQRASKDLALCYNNALLAGAQLLKIAKSKSIALATLSANVGFPGEKATPIAATSVLNFIKKNPKAYSRIEFFVEKQSDFMLYKQLLIQHIVQHCKPIKAICLLRWTHENEHAPLSILPLEIMDYIMQLMLYR